MGLISSIRNFYAISKPVPLGSDAVTAAAESTTLLRHQYFGLQHL